MEVEEVSLVDTAANLRKFVLTKRDSSMADTMTLKLPGAAKTGIMDGLAQCLDKATALATMVSDAEVDDAATVPEELGTALKQVGEMFSGMAQQYAPTGAPAASADGSAPPPPDGQQAPPPADAAGKSATAPTAKALPAPMHDGDSMKNLLRDGDSIDSLMTKALAMGYAELAGMAVEKAGRKISGARHSKLAELHSALGKLVNDLAFDQANEAAAGTPAKKAAEAPVTKSATDLEKALADSNAATDRLRKEVADLRSNVTAIGKSAGESNAGGVEGDAAGAPEGGALAWPTDMAASVKMKKRNTQGR